MQLILLSRSRAVARSVDITAARIWLAGTFLIAGLAFAVSAGFRISGDPQTAAEMESLVKLEQEISSQQAVLAEIEIASNEQIDALAVRMAELNASVIRLNALGQRLTSMADLEDGEFDFESFPAVGGPIEATQSDIEKTGQLPKLMTGFEHLTVSIDLQKKQLEALEALLLKRKLYDRVHPSGRPVNSGWISSFFGRRTDPLTGKSAVHKGIDFAGKYGADVVAVSDGVVVSSGKKSGFGNLVEIAHGHGYMTRYAHNQENLVQVGDQVSQGETIAYLGSSGRSTGPHVHFEVWRDGRAVDPARFISRN
jgi:murein DD-endopeptidase MepM/ murein hydrolase activator NlpD